MSLHYQSTNGLQGVVKTNKGIEIRNARLNVKNATPGLSFNGNDELVNEWYNKQPQNDVDMNSNTITNLRRPTQPQDATSKKYVDSLAGTPALKDSLRAYYSFDNTLEDLTTNGYDGSANGTTFNNTTAIINQSLEFTSDSDYVDAGNAFYFGTEDFTISVWVYPNVIDSSRPQLLANLPNDAKFIVSYGLGNNPQFAFYTFANGSGNVINSPHNFPANQWYHLVVTKTGSTGEIWVNGQKVKTGVTKSGNFSNPNNSSYIGGDPNNSVCFDGYLDELGAWNRVLSQGEIQHLYYSGSGNAYLSTYDWYSIRQSNHINMNNYRIINMGEALNGSDAVDKNYVDSRKPMSTLYTGARAYYDFEGDYKDSIGSYDGTNNGATLVSGKLNQAMDTQGGSGYVTIGSAFDWGSSDFTVSLWVYPRDGTTSSQFLGATGSGTSKTNLIYTSGNFSIYTHDGTGVGINSNNPYPPNRWHHVVYTRTGSTGQIYVNGQLDTSGTVASGDISEPNGYIGDNKNNVYDGLIDEFGVWDRVLTKNEVKYLYHEGQGTNDFVSYDYTMNYDLDMNQNQILNLASAQTSSLTIADDSVKTVSPVNSTGVMMISAYDGIVMAFYDVNLGTTTFIQQKSTAFNNADGTDLTGTTGNDGTINISCNSGEIHIENRSGVQTTVRLLTIF